MSPEKKENPSYTSDIPDDIINAAAQAVERTGTAELDVEVNDDSATADEAPAQSIEEIIASGEVPQQILDKLAEESERARAAQERMLRALAETENTRRRIARDKDEALRFANEKLLRELIPVIDNLDLALSHATAENEGKATRLQEGVGLTLRQFLSTLEKYGVKKIEVNVGTKFDPHFHEAVAQDPSSPLPANTVSAVLHSGFTYNDRLLRAAMVAVSVGQEASSAQNSTADEPDTDTDLDKDLQ